MLTDTGADAGRWLAWAACAVFILLLSPAMRGAVARRPSIGDVIIAGLAVTGVTLAVTSGAVAPWRVAAFAGVTGATLAWLRRKHGGYRPAELLAVAIVLGLIAGAWDRAFKIPTPGGVRIGYSFFFAVALGLYVLAVRRPLASLDVNPGLGARQIGVALAGTLLLAVVAVPLGAMVDYVTWNPRPGAPLFAVERLLGLVLFVGLPEELLFRGLLQEGVTRLRGPRVGVVVASLLFGFVHIFKATGLMPDQINALDLNWRYAGLAGLAGVSYGLVYLRTRSVAAAAVTHGAVDWRWSSFCLR